MKNKLKNKIINMIIYIKSLKNKLKNKIIDVIIYIKSLYKWFNGFTGFYDSEKNEIWVGDFMETFDSTGKRWTAFIERKRYKMQKNGKMVYRFRDAFKSNWEVILNSDCSKDFTIIKKWTKK